MMRETTTGDHYRIEFDSFADYLDYHADRPGKASWSAEWNGAESVAQAVAQAKTGLGAEGLAALDAASDLLPALDAAVIDQRFQPIPSTEGGQVDIGLYLSGEPECMVSYDLDQTTQVQPIVTLVVATGILGRVSAEAIAERGKRVMALLQAIELAGIQAEIWSDSTTHGGSGLTGRISVRLKAAGEPFDAGQLMYCMTANSMHRTLGFNTKDHFPKRFASVMGSRAGYGSTALGDLIHAEDYPEGTVYLRALRDNSDRLNVEDTLRELGLMH